MFVNYSTKNTFLIAIAGIISLIILPSEIRRPEESAMQQPIEPVLATGD